MAMDGEWGDCIALWGLINMLEIPVAVVSSLGETGLNVIYPSACENKEQATGDMALLGHEAELHYHSLEPTASQNSQLAVVQELKQKYGEGKITEDICPRCGRHTVSFRAVKVERYRFIQTTAFFATVASWRIFSEEL